MTEIQKAAVIGAGTIGAGIAAQIAKAGSTSSCSTWRRTFAEAGGASQLKDGGFMDPDFGATDPPGATTDDLALLADADWIIEAVAERLDDQAIPLSAQSMYIRKVGIDRHLYTSTIP